MTENRPKNSNSEGLTDSLKTLGAIKGDAKSETVIESKTSKIKMRFSNMFACAAVIGYTAAVHIESENTLDTRA